MSHLSTEDYALELVVDGAISLAEDDMNELGEIEDRYHEDAVDLAIKIAHAIDRHHEEVLSWVRPAA